MNNNFYSFTPSAFSAATAEVADTTGVFDLPSKTLPTNAVPGFQGDTYVRFGWDDQLPYQLANLVGADEVTAENKLFNVLTCYGAGLRFERKSTADLYSPDDNLEAANDWAARQSLNTYFLEQITDMKYFYFTVCVIILSRDGRRINRLRHKEACYCRFAPADRNGHIPFVYYGNFRDGLPPAGSVEKIPLLDERDPLTDLMQKMGREPLADGKTHPAKRGRKFALLMKFPTVGCQYYPVPYWASVLRGGSYDEKRLISVGKRAMLRNHTSVKYQVEVEQGYWEKICREEFITDPEKQRARIRKEKENIRDFVAGIENTGKVWISAYYVNPDGKEIHDIKITKIDTGTAGGDWADDVQAAANTICYADNIHPNLVGAVPGKSQSNNSGSDKRELFTMKQALECAFHDILLMPLRLVCRFNGWRDVTPTVPFVQLTTLDEHKDAKEVTTP